MTFKLLSIFILVFTPITGISGAPLLLSLYDEFMKVYLERNCSIPQNVILPEMVVDKNFSVPLKVCKNEESDQSTERIDMKYHICTEVFEILDVIACRSTADTPEIEKKPINISLSSDVCADFHELEPDHSKRYAFSRLKEYAVCTEVCDSNDMNKICLFFLWIRELFNRLVGTPNNINNINTKEISDTNKDSTIRVEPSSKEPQENPVITNATDDKSADDHLPVEKSDLPKQNNKKKIHTAVVEKGITSVLKSIASYEMTIDVSSTVASEVNKSSRTDTASMQTNERNKVEKSNNVDKASSLAIKEHSVDHTQTTNQSKGKINNMLPTGSGSKLNKGKENTSSKSTSEYSSTKSDSSTKSSSSISDTISSGFSKIPNAKTESSKSSSENKFVSISSGARATTNDNNSAMFVNTAATDAAPLEEMENSVNGQGIQNDEEPSDTPHTFDGKNQNELHFNENSLSPDVITEDRNPQRSSNVQSADSSKDVAFGSDVLDAFDGTFPEQEESHFFFYLVSIVAVTVTVYILYHNRQKILALIIEGRHERRRRSHGVSYKKLET